MTLAAILRAVIRNAWSLVAVFVLTAFVVGCNAAQGDPCQEDDDCQSGLICAKPGCSESISERGTCEVECTGSPPRPDAGPRDAGPPPVDAGPADSGPEMDSGPGDAGPPELDAGPLDAGPVDAGRRDAGRRDAGLLPDAGL